MQNRVIRPKYIPINIQFSPSSPPTIPSTFLNPPSVVGGDTIYAWIYVQISSDPPSSDPNLIYTSYTQHCPLAGSYTSIPDPAITIKSSYAQVPAPPPSVSLLRQLDARLHRAKKSRPTDNPTYAYLVYELDTSSVLYDTDVPFQFSTDGDLINTGNSPLTDFRSLSSVDCTGATMPGGPLPTDGMVR